MGVFDNELILPGTITEITSDFSFGYDESLFGTTDTVTIIGTAFNGPKGKPVPIYSPEHANYVFGEAYDYKTRREATLVAEIKDAWDRGCRSIYAIRVSGKDISKDFSLVPETKLELRVSGLFPSNSNKDVYMTFDNRKGAEMVKIYKPAKKATLQEKREGLVDKEESILVTKIDLAGTYGLTADSRLVELLKVINEHPYNNVLRLSIVDENGADVTVSSKEAQALSVGSMFPGAYFIGRDRNSGVATTNVNYHVIEKEADKPYESFDQPIFKLLKLNSDVTSKYPIYAEKAEDLNAKFQGKVIMASMFDFLEVVGKVDEVFGKDKVDYEEVELANFDLYQRLGSGFATTAKAIMKGEKIKVMETPVSDANRIMPINDGIYSMLESLKSDYRVLAGAACDTAITGKLPKADEFKIAVALKHELGTSIVAKAALDPKDMTEAKEYSFEIKALDPSINLAAVPKNIYTQKTVKCASVLAEIPETHNYKEGSLFVVENVLYRITGKEFVALTEQENQDLNGTLVYAGGKVFILTVMNTASRIAVDVVAQASDIDDKEYLIIESDGNVFVYKTSGAELTDLIPVGSVSDVFNKEIDEDNVLVVASSVYGEVNKITIQSAGFDTMTVEELVEILNENKDLVKLFDFELSTTIGLDKDSYIDETDLMDLVTEPQVDKTITLDTNLYIPYRTTDNFARHLAQHCKYTSLKTAPTHGIIGCAKLLDTSLTSVAQKVKALLELNLNLYAKKPNGTDVLDRNNLPYPIGSCVSVPFGQYLVNTLDGYTYISNGASGYAGMISALPIEQSSTNQTILIDNLMFELTNYQLEKLTQKGLVTFKQSYTKGIVVTDGVTMESAASPFRRLSTARIINRVEELIREATEPFIGKQNHLANKNAMQTAIKSRLKSVEGRLIKASTFKLVYDSQAEMMGIVDIDYRIVPIYEIREIRNRITVTNKL